MTEAGIESINVLKNALANSSLLILLHVDEQHTIYIGTCDTQL